MPKIQPTKIMNKHHITAVKQFTDRKHYIEAFWNCIYSIQNDDTKVLVYYGVSGIGKSSLRKKLQHEIEIKDENILWGFIDFDVRQHRDVDNALLFLRTELSRKYKISFNLFDFAYAYYLKKASPQMSFTEKSIPFLEEGSLVTDIIATFGDMPLVGIPVKILAVLDKVNNKYKDWINQKRINDILDMSLKEPKELLEYLPVYFAEDLKNYASEKNGKIVIFLDTYEALNSSNKGEKSYFQIDEWIRDVLIPNLPGGLFVILGREKLKWQDINSQWAECIEQHLVGTLADVDSRSFLVYSGIKENEIINSIIEISEGHPYFLDLCVDTYEAIKKGKKPTKEDFLNNNKIQLFEKFMQYLQYHERETLKVLSVPRFWNSEIFELLIKEYNTGYPIMGLDEFCNFSFISERALKDTWEMHSLMRKSLNEYQKNEQLIEVHKVMFKYYSKKLKNVADKTQEIYLNEAYYHGSKFLKKDEFGEWFLDKSDYFFKMGNILFLKHLYEKFFQEVKDETNIHNFSFLLAQSSYRLGKIYISLGSYLKAEEILKYAEIHVDKAENLSIIGLLAVLYKDTYKDKESEKYFQKYISNYNELRRENLDIYNSIAKIKILINYGKLKVYLSEYEDALDIYNKVVLEIEDLLKEKYHIYTLLSYKADALEKLGEVNERMRNYSISGKLYKKAIKIYDYIINEHELHQEEGWDLIYLLNNKGMVYKRLAEYYVEIGKSENAKHSYRRALESYEYSKEKSCENIDTYKKIGFAARGLLRQLVNDGSEKKQIEKTFYKCEEGFMKALELSPKDVSAIHSMGGAYMILGKSYEKEMNYFKSLELYDKALRYSSEAIGIQPDYLYAYDGKAEILIHKAEIYSKMNDVEKALSLYKEGLIVLEEILKKTPKACYALEKKELIKRMICELKSSNKFDKVNT